MDGMSPPEQGDSCVFPSVSLCRGRLSQPDTFGTTGFTREQLDALAPLSRKDMKSLAENRVSPLTKDRVQQRIRAAQSLKYGVHDAD